MNRHRSLMALLCAVAMLWGCGKAAAAPAAPSAPYDGTVASGSLEVKVHVPQRSAPAGSDLTVQATVSNRSSIDSIKVQLDCAAVWVDVYDAKGQLLPRMRPMCMPAPVSFAPGESRTLQGSVRLDQPGSYSIVVTVAGLKSDRIAVQAR